MLKQFKNRLLGNIPLQFDTATLSQIGGRDHLEDAVGYWAVDPNNLGWVLADGVGGQGLAKWLHDWRLTRFCKDFATSPTVPEIVCAICCYRLIKPSLQAVK
jgi:serine/threonine protein phosphatase PrpC